MNINVLIADDQALIRSGLRAIIESEPGMEVVGEAGDGADAVEAVRRLRPHVALMDIRMPRLDGVAATRALLRGAAPVPTKILILTTFHLDAYVTEALRAGASGFLLKEATADQLIEAVRVIASGEAILAPSVTRRLLERMAEDSAATGDGGQQIRDLLSAREADVLLLVARGLSNAEIGAKLHLAETTVKSHVQSMLGKLGVRDRLLAIARGKAPDLDRRQGRVGGGLDGGGRSGKLVGHVDGLPFGVTATPRGLLSRPDRRPGGVRRDVDRRHRVSAVVCDVSGLAVRGDRDPGRPAPDIDRRPGRVDRVLMGMAEPESALST